MTDDCKSRAMGDENLASYSRTSSAVVPVEPRHVLQ